MINQSSEKTRNKLKEVLKFARIAVGILALIFSFSFAQDVEAATLNKPANNLGLVGYWAFDDGAGTRVTDFSGNKNNGTLTNGPTWVTGKKGSAVDLDGVNDYIDAGNSSTLSPTSAVTVSAWIYMDGGSTDQKILGNQNGSAGGYKLGVYSSNVLEMEIRGSANTDDNTRNTAGGTALAVGRWYHVVGVYSDAADTLQTYVNGVLDKQMTATKSMTASGNLIFGKEPFGASNYWNGKIDDVRIYNRALGATEIAALYNAGAERIKPAVTNNGLVSYWSFEDGTSTTATDLSGNKNTATLTNMSNPPTLTSGWTSAGRVGKGLNFDGTDDYVVSSKVISTSNVTVSAWVKIPSVPASGQWVAGFMNGNNSTIYDKDIYIGSDGKAYFYVYDGAAKTTSAPSAALPLNTWVHLVGVANGTNAIMYVNGVQVGSVAAGATYTSYNVPNFFISGTNFGGSMASYIRGSIDEVRVYNRALSISEIQGLYTTGAQKVNASQINTGTTLDNGIVGVWSFDGRDMNGTTAYDRSGNGNNGTLTNGPVPTIGKVGQALRFDGSDDLVSLTNNPSLQLTTALTVSAWVKTLDTQAGIVSKFNGSNQGYRLYTSGGYAYMAVNASGNGLAGVYSNTGVLGDGAWHHVVGTWDGSTIRLYVDGTLQTNTASQSGTIIDSGNAARIGDDFAFGALAGIVDEARIYSRPLSAAEVKLLYNMGK